MAENLNISWGKPTIRVRKRGETTWDTFPTPVENSTQITATRGDKLEAKIEGGANEAVKYKANTYALVYAVRQAPGREMPIEDVDGVVHGEYEVQVIPESPGALGATIDRAACNVQTNFTANEGIVKTYTFDVLKPEEGSQVKLEVLGEGISGQSAGIASAGAQIEPAKAEVQVAPASANEKPKKEADSK